MKIARLTGATLAAAAAVTLATSGATDPVGEWRSYAATNAGGKYAALDQINRASVKELRVAWRQSSMPEPVRRGRGKVAVPTNYQVTPLMAGGLLFASAGDGSVFALSPGTGAVVWSYVPPDLVKSETRNDPPGEMLVGRSANRGVAYWSGGGEPRVVAITGQSLVALDAKSGVPAGGFGVAGTVDLSQGYRRPAASMRWTSVPLVVGDVIVVGGLPTAPDGNFMPGDVRGYDARTGKLVWTFNVIPEFGEVGNDTWLKDSYLSLIHI